MTALLLVTCTLSAQERPRLVGRSLREALQTLQAASDLEIVFSDHIVRDEMIVAEDPGEGSALELLARLLAAHDLTTEAGPGGRWVVVPIPRSQITGVVRESLEGTVLAGVEVRIPGRSDEALSDEHGRFELPGVPVGTHSISASLAGFGSTLVEGVHVLEGHPSEIEVEIDISIVAAESVVVSPSVMSIFRGETTQIRTLASGEIAGLPVAGGDFVRAAKLLPGVAGGDFTARVNVRGGRSDEVLVLFDGVELLEPYHLKDFESALSIVPPRVVERMEFLSGGFPATYGDRMSAVLDMTTIVPGGERRSWVRVSTLDSQIGTSNSLAGGRGRLLLSGRVSSADPALDSFDLEEDPRFWDVFGKLAFDISDRQTLRLEALEADDDFQFAETSDTGNERTSTDYRSAFAWFGHNALLGSRMSLETIVSVGRADRDRRGFESSSARRLSVSDQRRLDVGGIKHQGAFQVSPSHTIRWGGEIRQIDSEYGYANSSWPQSVDGPGDVTFMGRFSGRQLSLFASGRHRLSDDLTVEVGARFDESEIIEDSHVSPRISMAYAPSDRSVLRVAWGHYYQSQRANELQVEDGETTLSPDERQEMAVVAYEWLLDNGLSLRIEAYGKRVSQPRARYENLFDPLSRFPEVEPDRFRIAPQRAHAKGVELFARRQRARLDWWASYAYSRVEDEIDGRDVPRAYDQPHAAKASVTFRISPRWTLGASAVYHTGWPKTVPSLTSDLEGQPGLELGPLYGDRLRDYQRVDVRLTRSWELGHGEIAVSADVLNLLGRRNVRGFEYLVVATDPGEWTLQSEAQHWLGTVPIIGVDWEF